jgi:hypothetical protein
MRGRYPQGVIVVVGNPVLRRPVLTTDGPGLAGTSALVAAAAAKAGGDVQVVGRVGDDPDGDSLVLALAAAGVGHVALLRVAARRTAVAEAAADDDGIDGDPASDDAEDAPPPPATDPDTGLEAADVDLALRYLTEFRVVVVTPGVPVEATLAATRAAGWTGGAAIVLVAKGRETTDLPDGTIVLESPADDRDGVFANLVGEYAAALDRGEDAGDAFRSLVERLGWEAPTPD